MHISIQPYRLAFVKLISKQYSLICWDSKALSTSPCPELNN